MSCFAFACSNSGQTKENKKEKVELNKNIPVYNFNELEPLLYNSENKIRIVNFWAMWCGPCVKELPYFQDFANKNPKIEVLLVSLDFPEDIETKLKPFLKKNNIQEKVLLLDDSDANTWINKIDPNWSGAIPFTLIFNNQKRLFFERPFENLEDIENTIKHNFNP